MCRIPAVAVLAFLVGISIVAADDRVAMPSQEDIEKSTKLVRELFKADYAKTTPKARAALAEKLFKQAEETSDDPAAQFVLLRETAELGSAGGDVDLALRAVEHIHMRFNGVKTEQLEALLKTVLLRAPTVESNLALTTYLLKIVDDAVVADDLEAAGRLVKMAETSSLKSKNVRLANLVSTRNKEIDAFKKDSENVKAALATLEKRPADVEANTIAGKYYCFQKGDWTRGLVHLAAGDDAKLKEIAAKEVADPKEPAELLAVADGWYELGNTATGAAKRAMQSRAFAFYTKAVPDLTGLSKTKAERRIEDLEKVAEGRGAHDELWAALRAATRAKEVEELTPIGGDWGRKDYRELAPSNGILIGFHYTTKKFANFDTIDFLQPIYLTPNGEKLGTGYGKAPPKESLQKTVKAKTGFAVGSLKVDAGGFLNGFSITFMRIKGKGLNPADSYESPWAGGKQDGGRSYSTKDSRPVIGLYGKKHDREESICSIGLIVAGPKSEKKP